MPISVSVTTLVKQIKDFRKIVYHHHYRHLVTPRKPVSIVTRKDIYSNRSVASINANLYENMIRH